MLDIESGKLQPLDFDPLAECENKNKELQKAMDKIQPDRKLQGPVFTEGEIVKVKGAPFKVHAITENRLYLTPIKKGD